MDRDPASLTFGVLRFLCDLSQQEVAARTGFTEGTISDYERGKKTPSPRVLRQLVEAMGFDPKVIEPSLRHVEEVVAARGSGAVPLHPSLREIAYASGREVTERLLAELPQRVAEIEAAQERERAAQIWERLRKRTPAEQRFLIAEAEELQSWALCEAVCEASERIAAHRADAALQLADLAVLVAEKTQGSKALQSRTRAYACAFLGNAQRVYGRLPQAVESFVQARDWWGALEPDEYVPLDEGRLLDLEASLRIDLGEYEEALRLLDQAQRFSSGPTSELRILLKVSRTHQFLGNHEKAVSNLRPAQQLAGIVGDRRTPWLVEFSLAVNLFHLGKYDDVKAMLPGLQHLVLTLGNDLDSLRLRWLKGRLSGALGLYNEAIATLQHVASEFLERGVVSDAARAAVHLAEICLLDGRVSEVRSIARRFEPVLKRLGLQGEARQAAELFCEAAEAETITLEIAQQLSGLLRRAL